MIVDHSCSTSFAVTFGRNPNFANSSRIFNHIARSWIQYQYILEGDIGVIIYQVLGSTSED